MKLTLLVLLSALVACEAHPPQTPIPAQQVERSRSPQWTDVEVRRQLKIGMTDSKVLELLGLPTNESINSVPSYDSWGTWHYYHLYGCLSPLSGRGCNDASLFVDFRNGRVTGWRTR